MGRRCAAALYVDCETTGFDWARDEVIEVGLLPFTCTADGRIAQRAARRGADPSARPRPADIAGDDRTDGADRRRRPGQAHRCRSGERADCVERAARRPQRAVRQAVFRTRAAGDEGQALGVLAARDSVAGVGHQQRRAALSAVPLRRIRPRPPSRARRLRGRRVAPCARPAGYRAERAVGAPRTLRGADGSALGGGLAIRGEGGAARSGVSMDAAGAQRHRPLVVDRSRARDGRRRVCVAQRRGLRGVPPGVPHRPGLPPRPCFAEVTARERWRSDPAACASPAPGGVGSAR